MPENRQIKLSITVDRESARVAKALVDDLYRSIERLQQAASKVSIGGGGGISSRAGDRAVAGGSGGVPRPGSMPGKGGGVIQSVLGVGDAGALRGLISGTEQAFQRIGADIRSFVDRAESDLKRLRGAVASVGGGGAPGIPGGGGGSSVSVPQGASYVWGGGLMPKGGTTRVPGAPGGGGPSVMAGVGQIGQAALGQAGVGWLGQGLGALGAAGAGAVVGGLGVAAIGGLIYAGGARQANVVSNLGYDVNAPISFQSGLGAAAGTSRGAYHAARALDMRYTLAYQTAMQDKASVAAAVNTTARAELARREAGLQGPTPNVLQKAVRSAVGDALGSATPGAVPTDKGFFAALGDVLHGAARREVSKFATGVDPTAAASRRAASDIEREQIERSIPGRVDAAMAERIQADMATQGRFADAAQYAVSAWQGNLSVRRLGRMGPGRRPDGTVEDPAEWALKEAARLERRGRTLDEVAGGRRGIMSSAGVGYLRAGLSAEGVIGMHEGGAVGVEGIVRSAGILGGSAGAGVRYGAGFGKGAAGLQQSIGRGGLDELAGSELFGSLYGRSVALGSQFGYTGNTAAGFVNAAAGLVYGGGQDVAEQQAKSMLLSRGLDQWAGTTSGKTAPLYQAYSVLTSMRSAGGFGALSEKLRETDPSVLASIARGGDVPAGLRGLLGPGQSGREVAASFLRQDRMAPFFESYGALAPAAGSGAAALLSKVRAAEASGGDFTDVVKSELRGLKGGARGRRVDEINQVLGSTAVGGAEGLFARELSDPDLAPLLRAGGAHGQGPQGTERAAAGASAAQKEADAGVIGGNTKTITDLIKSSTATGAAGEAMLKVLRGLQGTGLANLPSAEEMRVFRDGIVSMGRLMQQIGDGRMARAR